MKNCFLLGLIAMLAISGCKKSTAPAPTGITGTTGTTGSTGPKIDTDVYVVGSAVSTATDKYVAAYWKNGLITMLSDSNKVCFGTGITVSAGHVYATGYYYDGIHNKSKAVYWLDGKEDTLGLALKTLKHMALV